MPSSRPPEHRPLKERIGVARPPDIPIERQSPDLTPGFVEVREELLQEVRRTDLSNAPARSASASRPSSISSGRLPKATATNNVPVFRSPFSQAYVLESPEDGAVEPPASPSEGENGDVPV